MCESEKIIITNVLFSYFAIKDLKKFIQSNNLISDSDVLTIRPNPPAFLPPEVISQLLKAGNQTTEIGNKKCHFINFLCQRNS